MPCPQTLQLLTATPTAAPKTIARTLFAELLEKLRHQHLRQHIPAPVAGLRLRQGQHLHLNPEIFIQISGFTEFRCQTEPFRLLPEELCLMPAGTPHEERAFPLDGLPFFNLVIMFHSSRIHMHIAKSTPKHQPVIQMPIGTLEAETTVARCAEAFHALVENAADPSPTGQLVGNGILWTLLARLLHLLENQPFTAHHHHRRIGQCLQLIASGLNEPGLTVRRLAATLGCTPDYLSHRFHLETGCRLTEYINRQRIQQARSLLDSTTLTIAEIAWTCGYNDPAYFTRQFTRITGHSPRTQRQGGRQNDCPTTPQTQLRPAN
jgi:AraC-like DNA-binding protein